MGDVVYNYLGGYFFVFLMCDFYMVYGNGSIGVIGFGIIGYGLVYNFYSIGWMEVFFRFVIVQKIFIYGFYL